MPGGYPYEFEFRRGERLEPPAVARDRMGVHDFAEGYGRYSGGPPYGYEYTERTIVHPHPPSRTPTGFSRRIGGERERRPGARGGPGGRRGARPPRRRRGRHRGQSVRRGPGRPGPRRGRDRYGAEYTGRGGARPYGREFRGRGAGGRRYGGEFGRPPGVWEGPGPGEPPRGWEAAGGAEPPRARPERWHPLYGRYGRARRRSGGWYG